MSRRNEAIYLLFEAWMTDDAVRDSYQRSTGEQPVKLIRTAGGILAGPISKKEIERRKLQQSS